MSIAWIIVEVGRLNSSNSFTIVQKLNLCALNIPDFQMCGGMGV
jgi:hypothetical protein